MSPPPVAVPARMCHLKRDPRGYPIPAGVMIDVNGKPQFTINEEHLRVRAVVQGLCGICHLKLGRGRWFVGGPQSAFHPRGAYFDPPMHPECKTYALQVCPWLAAPHYGRVIEARLVPKDEVARVYVDPTQTPGRPEVFVAVLAATQTRDGMHVIPKRPFIAVEFWRHGIRLPDADGRAAVQRLLAENGLDESLVARACR